MIRLKSLSQVWRHSLYLPLISLILGCLPVASHKISVSQYQKALELIDQGTLLLRAERLGPAQGAFAAAFELAPIPAALDGLGCVAFLKQDYDLAHEYFIEAYRKDPNYHNSLGNLALLYDIRGFPEVAKRFYQLALEAEPENYRGRNNFAVAMLGTGNMKAAKLELLKALALAKHPTIAGNLKRLEEYE